MTDTSSVQSVPSSALVEPHAASAATAHDFWLLLKPRVMFLVVFTGFAGLVVAPGEIHPILALTAILCIAVGAGAAGCINMWYDRDIDAVMTRTAARPIPTGRVSPEDALAFGVALAVAAVAVMGLAVNWVAAALLALATLTYVFVYTAWLKRRTPQNIVIGGAAGAFPPMIGWAAVTGDVALAPVLLFLIIFLWTPPHFWALALYRCGEYARVGVPMLPVVVGADETKRQIFLYTVLLSLAGLSPYFVGLGGLAYLTGALVLGGLFLLCSVRLLREREGDKAAKQMFGYSIFYLFVLFALLIGTQWNTHPVAL